ncbi:hypothetical protein F4678DRAFT_29041 [Xylaria arbuscula]|nr:hypothetical protein F4678DRAFT_29041 [Xylaria arbuscula]
MGGGIKSKFKFPVPGRSSKKQQAQAVSVSGPLSKAQRILGADGLNIGSSRLAVDPGRTWETGSTGGISISISESSASQAALDVDAIQENRGKSRWEEESAIIPRQIRSAHGSAQRGVATRRPPFTGGNESRDNITNASTRGRRLSSSTIDTHYDSAKMPLSISQQTSNSAMAKGLPTKVTELLDIDGSLAGPQTAKQKKKPAKLDLSRLRPKGFRDRSRNAPSAEPILGNTYVMRSPSFMTRTPGSSMPSGSTAEERQRTPRKLTKQPDIRESPRSRGVTEPTGLRQLYQNYEQMSFQNEEPLPEETERGHLAAYSKRSSNNPRPASTFTHSLIAPIPVPLPPSQDRSWGHSRNNSRDSRKTASIAESSAGLQVHSSRQDYAGSISSRHTRTSKASPSSKSLIESDRLQNSVLSLSDSSDDEVIEPTPPVPSSYRESPPHDTVVQHPNPSKVQHNLGHLHATTSPRRFTPSLNQVDEHLAVKSAPRAQTSRSPSNNTLRSSQSSMSTLTPGHLLSSSAPDPRVSTRSTETIDTPSSSYQTGYGVQEARTVAFVPLASTVEAATKVSLSEGVQHLEKVLARQNSNATSHISHSSDQPTPPLSPNSVEFYVPSRESLQRDALANGSSEAHNARLMAVTRQEEMLLAALRQKRAKMRETVISEAEEDENGRTDGSIQDNLGNAKKSNMSNNKGVSASLVNPWPKRASSLFMAGSRENLREVAQQNGSRKELRDVDIPSTASRSDVTERTSTSASGSTTLTAFDSGNGQLHSYFDQPIDGAHTTDSSVDFSDDYMEDSDGEDLIVNERRTSRMQSRRDSASGAVRGQASGSNGTRRDSSGHSGQSWRDSIPANFPAVPLKAHRLQDVPEVESQPECDEDVDADDPDDEGLDGFPQPPMPPPSWPLPPRPGQPPAKLNSPGSAHFLHPSRATQQGHSPERRPGHMKNKRSMVRLSAVGHSNSPMPWWGDDD